MTLRRWQEALRALQRKGQRIAVAKKISLLPLGADLMGILWPIIID
jgi:hypothetical protein